MARRRREHGQGIVEFSMAVPLLLLFLFGIIEFSIVVFTYDTIANAAREGARAGVFGSASDQEIIDATLALTAGLQLTANDIVISHITTPAGDTDTVRVEITYAVNLITGPIIQSVGGNPTITLHTSSTMMVE